MFMFASIITIMLMVEFFFFHVLNEPSDSSTPFPLLFANICPINKGRGTSLRHLCQKAIFYCFIYTVYIYYKCLTYIHLKRLFMISSEPSPMAVHINLQTWDTEIKYLHQGQVQKRCYTVADMNKVPKRTETFYICEVNKNLTVL